MSDSIFDPDAFLNQEYQAETSTEYVLIPAGEYKAQVDGVSVRRATGLDGDDFTVLETQWHILDDKVAETIGRDKALCRQSIFLDLTDSGTIDMGKGKNVPLGYLRDAVKQNNPKKAWSPRNLVGAMATVKVDHKPRKNDPGKFDAAVTKVTEA